MTPLLFPSDATTFEELSTRGLGPLNFATSCIVKEEVNGAFDLTLQYPATAKRSDLIRHRSIILAPSGPDKLDDWQSFRVYRIKKGINGMLVAYARHTAIYDASGVVVKPFTASQNGVTGAAIDIQNNSINRGLLNFISLSEIKDGAFKLESPCSARAAIKQIIDQFGVELDYSKLTTYFVNQRGKDNGKSIRYGVDLIDYQQEENNLDFYTGVFPFWAGYVDGWFWTKNFTVASLGDEVVSAPGDFDFSRILPLDLSDKFDSKPSEAQLREAGQKYIAENHIGVPSFGLAVKRYAMRENMALGDTVRVYYPQIGVYAVARIMSLTWDVLKGRTTDLEIGSVRASIADTVAGNLGSIASLGAALYHRTNVDSSASTTAETKEGGTENADGTN